MKKSTFAWYILIVGLVACADPKNRKQYIEALENRVFENNVKLSMKAGQSVEIKDQSGNIKKTPLIDKDGDGIAEGLDLDGDGIIDVNVMKGRHKKETAEKFTIEIDINGDGITDYYFAVEKTATGYRITLVAAASTSSQQLAILQTNDIITGIDSTGDNVSDDNRLNGKNCTNTGSAPADSTAPATPGSLNATAAGQTQINLTWTASTDNTTPTGNLVYEICQSTTAGGCDSFSVLFNSSAGATSYNITGLSPLTNYYYRIRARDIAANRSAATGEQFATTQSAGTVANPTFSVSAGFFTAAQNITFSSTTTGVTFCYTTNGSAPTCNSAGACQTGTAGNAANITSTATLKAVACRSGYVASSEISAAYTIDSVAPAAPTSPTTTAAGSDQIQLTWTAATDNTSSSANLVYEICQSTTAGACDNFSVTYTTGAGATNYLVGSLTPVTTYYFRVRSKDQAGNTGTPTAEQSATTTTTGTVSAPSYSPVAGTYNSSQNVIITSSTSASLICYTTNGDTPACNATPACTTGTAYSTAVSIGSTATLRAIGCKAVMTNSTVTVGSYAIDTVAPANVTAFTATAGSNQVSLSWTNPGDADFAGTKVLRKTGSYPTDQNDGTTVYNSTGTSYTNTGLTAGTQYYYKAFSFDSAGNYAGGAQATGTPVAPGSALWARTLVSGGNRSVFNAVIGDGQDNAYAAGYQTGTGSFDYGNSITVSGGSSSLNAVFVKYNSNGQAQLARTTTTTSGQTNWKGIAVDNSSNIIAVGTVASAPVNFGSGISATGPYPSGNNALIAKYNSSGTILWARSVESASYPTEFRGVTTDSAGNIYAVGIQNGTFAVNYGNSNSISGIHGTDNAVLVKYNANGDILWVRAATSGPGWSIFNAVARDSTDQIYVAGYLACSATAYNFGNGVAVTSAGGSCPILLKYDVNGNAQWGKSTTGTAGAGYNALAIDSANNIYTAGVQISGGTSDFGNSVTSGSTNNSVLLVKYSASGTPTWARTLFSANSTSAFTGVAAFNDRILAIGSQGSSTLYTYALGAPHITNDFSCFLVVASFDHNGNYQWVKGSSSSFTCGTHGFYGSAIARVGLFGILAGYGNNQSMYTFATGVTSTGPYASGENSGVVKYAP